MQSLNNFVSSFYSDGCSTDITSFLFITSFQILGLSKWLWWIKVTLKIVKIIAQAQRLWYMVGVPIITELKLIHPNVYFSVSFGRSSAKLRWTEKYRPKLWNSMSENQGLYWSNSVTTFLKTFLLLSCHSRQNKYMPMMKKEACSCFMKFKTTG